MELVMLGEVWNFLRKIPKTNLQNFIQLQFNKLNFLKLDIFRFP